MREVMQSKWKTFWKDLREDERAKVFLLPIPIIISILTFGICVCIREEKEVCDFVDIFLWPVDFLHASIEILFNGTLNVAHGMTAGKV